MKKFLLGGVAFGALIMPAMAGDLAPLYGAPPPLPVIWSSWTGFYVGANLGWIGSSNNTLTNTGTDTGAGGLGSALAAGFIPGSVGVSHNGFIGGGQIGYNWQFSPFWVAGIEADYDGILENSTTSVFASPSAVLTPFTTTFTSGLDNLGTVRVSTITHIDGASATSFDGWS
jgi:outer membrane immunogenic protein